LKFPESPTEFAPASRSNGIYADLRGREGTLNRRNKSALSSCA
jgi:hypothetical protein